jgi:quercetin dioxygenase-like cupin family protein
MKVQPISRKTIPDIITRRNLMQRTVLALGAVWLNSGVARGESTTKGHIVSAADGPDWQMSPGRTMSYKLLSEHTGDAVAILEETVPAGDGTPLHIHRTSDEVIHLMEGQLKVKLADDVTTVGPGAWIFIPRGVTHGWRNTGTIPARASFTFTPADGGKLFEQFRLLGPLTPENLVKAGPLMKRYGFELVARTWD